MSDQANPEQGAVDQNSAPEPTIEQQIGAFLDLEEEIKGNPEQKNSGSEEEGDGKPSTPEASAEGKSEEEESSTEETEETDEGTEESEGEEDTDEDVSEEEGEEAPQFESLAELAEAAGMSESDIKAMIKDTIKVQGEDIEVTYDDLLKGQMLESDYRLKTQRLAEERKEFDEVKTSRVGELKQQVDEGVQVLQAIYADYLQLDKDTNWERLKDENPHEYNLKRMEASEKFQKLEAFKAQLAKHNEKIAEQEREQQDKLNIAFIRRQNEALSTLIPAWISEPTKQRGIGEVRQYLKNAFEGDLAYTDQELDSMVDARIVFLAKMAMDFENTRSKADFVKKRVSKVTPKLKPKGKVSDKKTGKKTYSDAKSKAKKTGDMSDATAAILAGMK